MCFFQLFHWRRSLRFGLHASLAPFLRGCLNIKAVGQTVVYVVSVETKRYPTDLTDSQWFSSQHLMPAAKPGGRSHSLDMRSVVDAILFGRHKHQTAGSIDSRTVKTDQRPAGVRGYLERTFAWIRLNHRLCADYERLPASSVAFFHIAMIRLMVRRLGPARERAVSLW